MSPSSVRTATAQLDSPRIITPSMTAWPPMYRGWFDDGIVLAPVGGLGTREECQAFFLATLVAFWALAYRRWKRSTRPPVSTSFCLPV